MKKVTLYILIAFSTSYMFGQKNSEVLNTNCRDFNEFYWIDTLENDSIENYENMFFYKETHAARVTMIAEKRAYFSQLYAHFLKQLPELAKIIEFGKIGYDGIKAKPSTVNGKKSSNCILLSLHNEYVPFDKSKNVLMVIKNETYTLKLICPMP